MSFSIINYYTTNLVIFLSQLQDFKFANSCAPNVH